MRFDFEEITHAWIDSVFATEIQRQIASERNTICQSCPSLQTKFKKVKKLSIQACGECGCPISKKIFSRKFNACPLSKWGDVDEKYKDFFVTQFQKKDNI